MKRNEMCGECNWPEDKKDKEKDSEYPVYVDKNGEILLTRVWVSKEDLLKELPMK